MSKMVSFTQNGEIGIITVDNPPVNTLSPGVPEGIIESIDRAEEISGADMGFVAR